MNPNMVGRNNNLQGDLEENLATAEMLISKWDTETASPMLFQSNPEEAGQYLAAVDNLQQVMEMLSVQGGGSAKMIRAERMMKMSMARLRNEFHKILLCNSDPVDPDRASSTRPGLSRLSSISDGGADDDSGREASHFTHSSIDTTREAETVLSDAVADLRNIVQRMASTGYAGECVRVFTATRKSVVEESFYNLGVEKKSLHDVHKMEWALLYEKIKKWIYAAKISIRLLFAREKRLCDQVFEGFTHMGDSCFAEIAKEPTFRLLGFAEAVAAGTRSPEKIFRVLDMYETLTGLMPDMEDIYCQEPCRSIKAQAAGILTRLGEAARGILTDFENSLEKDNSKTPIPGGAIHPLTRYIVNYLGFLLDYKETLVNLTANMPVDFSKDMPEGFALAVDDDLNGAASLLGIRLRWIVVLLQCNLDGKSKLYKDVALSYLFLLNNLNYVIEKVQGSELKSVMGKEWPKKQSIRLRQYAAGYERAAWTKLLSCLTDEGIPVGGSFSGGVSQQALKDRFKAANSAIEEVMKSHAGWVVADVRLREELQISISEKLIPAYRSFFGTFGRQLEIGKHSYTYLKFTPEKLEKFVLNLFKGSAP